MHERDPHRHHDQQLRKFWKSGKSDSSADVLHRMRLIRCRFSFLLSRKVALTCGCLGLLTVVSRLFFSAICPFLRGQALVLCRWRQGGWAGLALPLPEGLAMVLGISSPKGYRRGHAVSGSRGGRGGRVRSARRAWTSRWAGMSRSWRRAGWARAAVLVRLPGRRAWRLHQTRRVQWVSRYWSCSSRVVRSMPSAAASVAPRWAMVMAIVQAESNRFAVRAEHQRRAGAACRPPGKRSGASAKHRWQ
jgi:hypothetical protein